jgi:hypothetical protein
MPAKELTMNDILASLLSSPLFYALLIVLVLAVFFRKQIAGFIERMTSAEGTIGKDGVQGKLQATPPSSKDASTSVPSPTSGKVEMEDVLLDHASEIDEITGKVKMKNVILDEKSKIGKINGGG